VVPLVDLEPNEGTRGQHPFNAVDYSPLLRAALVNLDAWVSQGSEPPASIFPRLADGTAVPAEQVIERLRALPGVHLPDPRRLPRLPRVDLGPRADQGIGRWPADAGEPYPTYVSTVDADGNELGGIRLPDLEVPLATSTGWNTRHPDTGGQGQLIPMAGSSLALPTTAEQRQRSGDPRSAIDERYAGRDDYLERVRAAAQQLVEQRLLLAEDVEAVVQSAAERYDTFAGAARPEAVPAR
jgi:hypothetical protein